MDAWRMFNNFLKLWLLFSTEEGLNFVLGADNGAFVITVMDEISIRLGIDLR